MTKKKIVTTAILVVLLSLHIWLTKGAMVVDWDIDYPYFYRSSMLMIICAWYLYICEINVKRKKAQYISLIVVAVLLVIVNIFTYIEREHEYVLHGIWFTDSVVVSCEQSGGEMGYGEYSSGRPCSCMSYVNNRPDKLEFMCYGSDSSVPVCYCSGKANCWDEYDGACKPYVQYLEDKEERLTSY